ncbi:hypothetical protein Tdes44962_MAKER07859 [Teratosphaeria destructans]|uniref:Uncharacterized protein n=1 Tax=Teratosphaeria destructans TaxID=418781 RepID=A0A9W7SY46_9PEZI|nr:hypothetical protein Tdes44962_MAKER07859 [Teratosphaeria destructans]
MSTTTTLHKTSTTAATTTRTMTLMLANKAEATTMATSTRSASKTTSHISSATFSAATAATTLATELQEQKTKTSQMNTKVVALSLVLAFLIIGVLAFVAFRWYQRGAASRTEEGAAPKKSGFFRILGKKNPEQAKPISGPVNPDGYEAPLRPQRAPSPGSNYI